MTSLTEASVDCVLRTVRPAPTCKSSTAALAVSADYCTAGVE